MLGVRCYPTLTDLPEVPDAIVIATPAATVPGLIDEAGRLGVGGAVVIAAGFAEVEHGRELQHQLRDNALKYDLPVCGPNGNGLSSVVRRAPLWGDGYNIAPPGGVALVSQSGNVAVNAIGAARALYLHTVISCGNQAVLEASDYLIALAEQDGVRSVALYLEAEGDGAKLAEGLGAVRRARDRRRGTEVRAQLTGRVGCGSTHRCASPATRRCCARSSRKPALPGSTTRTSCSRPPRRWRTDAARPGQALAVITCSGGDAAISADEADRLGIPLPPLAEGTEAALEPILPHAATIGNPLDYTAMIWGDVEGIADIVRTTASDPSLGQVVVYYDLPQKMGAAATYSWNSQLDGILLANQDSDAPVIVASTLPDLLPEDMVDKCLQRRGSRRLGADHRDQGGRCDASPVRPPRAPTSDRVHRWVGDGR